MDLGQAARGRRLTLKRVGAAVPAASAPAQAAVATAAPVAPAGVPAPAASGPESTLDRLQRRLTETMGGNGSLETGAGELKLTSRRGTGEPSAARRSAATANAAAHASRAGGGAHDSTHWSY